MIDTQVRSMNATVVTLEKSKRITLLIHQYPSNNCVKPGLQPPHNAQSVVGMHVGLELQSKGRRQLA